MEIFDLIFFYDKNTNLLLELLKKEDKISPLSFEKNPDRLNILNQYFRLLKIKNKIPSFFNHLCFIPETVFEQATSEKIAIAKSSYFNGSYFLDATAGLGIDSIAFANNFNKVIALEPNLNNFNALKYNLTKLKISNVEVLNQKFEEFIQNSTIKWDLIYLDPDRRLNNKRTFDWKDSSPNITNWISKLLETTKKVLIKLSPMIDISAILKEFPQIHRIWVMSHDKDCKEVLMEFDSENYQFEGFRLISISKNQTFSFESKKLTIESNYFSENKDFKYLLEADVVFEKSNMTDVYYNSLNLNLVISHPQGYAFTNQIPSNFMGKLFEIEWIKEYKPKAIKKYLTDNNIKQINITENRFIEKSEIIAKKLGVIQGGKDFLIFFTSINQKHYCILAKKNNEW